MSTVDATTQLGRTRELLADLAGGVESLAATWPEAFEDLELGSRLRAFRTACDDAKSRLAAPTLSIATLGTTSSGKSTLVNALVGRRVAPIEAGEASAGVLVLRHRADRCLTVERTDGAEWETGSWPGITDDEIYERVRNGVMLRYHAVRREKTCAAPQVIIDGPLLPGVEPALLGLPEGLAIEFIDLPGLKSVQDRTNLSVIQSRVHKAFSLVALDYSDADDDHRKRLLEELRRVVEHLQGRPDSMIFVLNRVDRRSRDDVPLLDRVAVLEQEIQAVLGLRERPEVLPMNALLLYNTQCAWGAASLEGAPSTSASAQRERIQALLEDCATTIRIESRNSPEIRRWLAAVEEQIDAASTIRSDDLRRLLQHARQWSGGARLWERLRARVAESFAELVLFPAVVEVLDAYDALAAALRTVSEVRQIKSREQAETERKRLDEVRRRLHEEVGATRERFRGRLAEAVQQLKLRDQALRHQITKQLGPGFESLLSAVDEVRGDLNVSLIAPVRDALKQNRAVYDVEDDAAKVVNPVLARDIASAYDRFSRQLPSLGRRDRALVLKVRADDPDGAKRIEDAERDAKRLFKAMREAMSARAEYTLQAQAMKIRGSLTGLLDEQERSLRELCSHLLPGFQLEMAIAASMGGRVRPDQIRLPDTFFELPKAVELRRPVEIEKVGERNEEYTTGTCFKDTHVRRVDVHGNVEYRELLLPDQDGMAQLWSKGVDQGEASLWETLRDWMTNALNESAASFSGAIDVVLALAQRELDTQVTILEQGLEAELEKWAAVQDRLKAVGGIRRHLHASVLSKRAARPEAA